MNYFLETWFSWLLSCLIMLWSLLWFEKNEVSLFHSIIFSQEDEKRRIEEAGGTVTKSHHAYRVDNYLATSRALGNCRWKPQNRIIATPDVLIFDLSEFRPQFIILATDGLWNIFTSEAAVNVIQKQFQQPFFGAQDLTRLSILWGSTDNTSIMVINLKNHAWPEKKPMEKKKSSRSLSSAFSSKRRSKSLASKSSSIRSPWGLRGIKGNIELEEKVIHMQRFVIDFDLAHNDTIIPLANT